MDEFKSIDINAGRDALALAQQEWGQPQPIDQALSTLVRDDPLAFVAAWHWYVVSIEHQQGLLAKAEIEARGLDAYLPMVPKTEYHGRGGQRTVWRPLFGLYMFVRCAPTQWGLASAARGVRRFLGRNGSPEPIEDRHIEVIRLVEAEKQEYAQQIAAMEEAAAKARAGGRSGIVWKFAEGDRIRIKNGPFAGFYAKLTSAVDTHDRIRALIGLFGGQSLTELSAFDVEKAV